MDFLKDIAKTAGNEYAALVSDGVEAGDVDSFIDTGSHIFNALLSGSLYGGLPSNKITAIAGESATGKTFFALGMVKQFLEDNKDAAVIYFESESASDASPSMVGPLASSDGAMSEPSFRPRRKLVIPDATSPMSDEIRPRPKSKTSKTATTKI